jgi:hypothetical protein
MWRYLFDVYAADIIRLYGCRSFEISQSRFLFKLAACAIIWQLYEIVWLPIVLNSALIASLNDGKLPAGSIRQPILDRIRR